MGPTPVGPLAALVAVGMVGGWLVRPLCVALEATPPRVTAVQPVALFVLAGLLAAVARVTHRAIHDRRGAIRAHEAVNRLVLAKSCALVGALVTGGYLGFALTWVGIPANLAGERILMSLLAASGAAATVAASLLLERACRVRNDDEEP